MARAIRAVPFFVFLASLEKQKARFARKSTRLAALHA
jgi:hypothetical protein